MDIYIDFDSKKKCWFYFTKDSNGYKTTTGDFKVHMDAVKHIDHYFKNKNYTIKWK